MLNLTKLFFVKGHDFLFQCVNKWEVVRKHEALLRTYKQHNLDNLTVNSSFSQTYVPHTFQTALVLIVQHLISISDVSIMEPVL